MNGTDRAMGKNIYTLSNKMKYVQVHKVLQKTERSEGCYFA